MSTQNPFFSFFTTYPGGTPLNNPDTTQSKGIEMEADGPPGDPLEITDTHNGLIKVLTPLGSVFNPSGRYPHRELNMQDGVHTFGLRANSSSAPFHQWVLEVGSRDTEDFEGIADISLTEVGQSANSKMFKITLLSKSAVHDFVQVADLWDIGPVKGKSLYGYIGSTPDSISYRLDILGRTSNQITLWAVGGNITTPSANLTLTFRNPAGAILHTINRTFTSAGNLQQIDSGALFNIASIEITADGQVIFDEFKFL